MYIDKRWILPGVLSIFLFIALAVVVTMAIMSAGNEESPDMRPASSVQSVDDGVDCAKKPAALVATAAPAPPPPPEPVESQFNDGGFGDIGMQFQNVNVGAPITNVHISNQGNSNTTNTIIGDNNTINNNEPPPPNTAAPATPEPSVEEPPPTPPVDTPPDAPADTGAPSGTSTVVATG